MLKLFDHNTVQTNPTQPQNLKVVGIYSLGYIDKNMVQMCPKLKEFIPEYICLKEKNIYGCFVPVIAQELCLSSLLILYETASLQVILCTGLVGNLVVSDHKLAT